jgi:putative transcription factor
MGLCELCGYDGSLHRGIVEGTMLHLCSKCLKFGNAINVKGPAEDLVKQRLQRKTRPFYSQKFEKKEENLVGNYYNLVKKARQGMGKTQEEVAQAIAERASVIQRVESGSLEPPLKLAKKLEQFFKIKLIEERKKVSSDLLGSFGASGSSFTIGDFVKRKK